MKNTKGWLMNKDKYQYVQIGRRLCRVHVEYEVESGKDLADFLKTPEGKDMLIGVSHEKVKSE